MKGNEGIMKVGRRIIKMMSIILHSYYTDFFLNVVVFLPPQGGSDEQKFF